MPRLAERQCRSGTTDRSGSAQGGRTHPAQRLDQGSVLYLQRMIGNREAQHLLQAGTAGAIDPAAGTDAASHPAHGGERRPAVSAEAVEASIRSHAGGGRHIAKASRERLEPVLAADLGEVRIHDGDRAAGLAGALGARAFTAGRDIFFGRGEYRPGTSQGLGLLAHEATHTVQQSKGRPGGRRGGRAGSATGPVPAIQKQEATPEQRTEFERLRERFARSQDEYFEEMGNDIRQHILQTAGLNPDVMPANAAQALQVTQLWDLSINDIVQGLPVLGQSLSTRVRGTQQAASLQQRSQQLVAAMTQQGQQTYAAAMGVVRSERFWRDHLDNHSIFIFPDLSGPNRYSGYTQRSGDRWNPAFIIHISKDSLEAGQTDAVVASLIHELSHTTFQATTGRAMNPMLQHLATLLADHPSVAALRSGASNASEARTTHIRRIRQILFERTAYAEAEIFVHLQQLTHQPPVTVSGGTIAPHHFLLQRVQHYIERLKRIRLPQRILLGTLDMIERRVRLLYNSRIQALPANTTQRTDMESFRDRALLLLRIARHETDTDT